MGGFTTVDDDSHELISIDSVDDPDATNNHGENAFGPSQEAPNLPASERYEILHTHAEGGLGRVSLAEDRELRRNVALKQIKSRATETSRQRFVFEAKVTGYLEHPGIVPVYSFASDEAGNPFYTMRFVDGDTLGDAIKHFHQRPADPDDPVPSQHEGHPSADRYNSFAFRQLLNRFVDLCNAIDYAHHRGIIHRDLKPANVMLGRFGETLVVDWGLARQVGGAANKVNEESIETLPDDALTFEDENAGTTRPGAVVGTPAFMSPEQANGTTIKLTPQSDIYSLGSILYVILTGQRAFHGKQVSQVLEKVRASEFSAPRDIERATPRPLNAICLKAMSIDPKDRYGSARELADDIDRWLADEPVQAWPEPLATRAMRWMKHHRVAVASSVVGLVIATASLGVILGVQRTANRRLAEANTNERAATEEAEKQFDLAVSAIQKYHDDIASDFLLGQAEFRELRDNLLQAPRAFYDQLTQTLEQKERPSRRQRVSLYNAHVQLGNLAEDLAAYQDGIKAFRKADQILDDLVVEFPDDVQFAEDHVRTTHSLAFLQGIIGESADAESSLREAEQMLDAFTPRDVDQQKWDLLRASLLRQRATLFSSQSRPDAATRCYEESLEIRRAILGGEVSNREETSQLAGTLNDYGNLLSNRGRVEEAEAAMRESATLLEQLLKEQPDAAFDTYRLASVYTNLAYICQATERVTEAIEIYEKSEPLFRTLTDEGSNIVVFQSGLASTLNNLGLLYADLENFDRAEDYYREALSIKERLVADHPLSIEYRVSLGGGYSNFGGFKYRTDDKPSAAEWFTRSIDTLAEVLEESPDQTTARYFSRSAHTNRGRTYRKLERHLDAAKDFLAASTFETDPQQQRSLLNQYAQSLAMGGQHRQAIIAAESLESNAKSDNDYFGLAFIYALAVTSAENDEKLDREGKEQQLQDYTERAVKALKAMNATGMVPRDVFQNLLEANEFLEPLRGREAFETFRAEFES